MTSASSSSQVIPWRTKVFLYLITAFYDTTYRSNGTINRFLINHLGSLVKTPANRIPVNGVKTQDFTVDPARNLWCRIFIPSPNDHEVASENDKLPVIVYFHGGAFTFLAADICIYDSMCRRFARKIRAIVVSVNYRLTPEHPYPSQYDDGFDTLKFLDGMNSEVLPKNADLTKCFLVGDSAGGNIAHHVACRAATAEFLEVKVIGLIPIQPFFGGEERTESELRITNVPMVSIQRTDWHWKAFLPKGSERDHEAANVFGPKSTDISVLAKFPATLVVVGGYDPLHDWQVRYYQGLKRSGKEAHLVDYQNVVHAFFISPEYPESFLLITEMKNFMEKQIDKNRF